MTGMKLVRLDPYQRTIFQHQVGDESGGVVLIGIAAYLLLIRKFPMKRILGGIVVGAALSASALAADQPTKTPAVNPVYSWTGCYLGGHVGGGWGRTDFSDPDREFVTTPGKAIRVGTNGVLGGGQVGCDWQFAPNWVIGIEGGRLGPTRMLRRTPLRPEPLTRRPTFSPA
jgi:hypothetical protein